MLESLISSRVRREVLRSVLLHPDPQTDYPRGLAAKLKLSYMPVQQELRLLLAAGIVRVQPTAGRHVYVADPTYPLFPELCALFKKSERLLAAPRLPTFVQKTVAYLGAQLPAQSQVYLFGSRATGKASKASDWDIGFLTKEPLPLTRYLGMKSRVRDMAWPHRIDVVDFQRVTPQFRELAMRHAKAIGHR